MKNTIVTVLTIVCLALGVTLLVQHTQARKQLDSAKTLNAQVTDERNTAWAQIDEQKHVITQLETNLTERKDELATKTTELEKTGAELTKAQNDVKTAQADAKAAQAEAQKLATQIAGMETEKDKLTQKMTDLQGSIVSLEGQISDTRKKLELAEGDRQTLLTQLKKLEAEKADLLAQFNNIRTLRTQLAKLKDEAAIAQRLAWTRAGVYINQEKKGAERLLAENATGKKEKTDNRLNVEIEQNGGAKVTSPKPIN